MGARVPSCSDRSFNTFIMAKAMKAMKEKTVSKIAKGKLAKAVVLHGNKEKTVGGLTKSDLFKNKRGRIVSKKASAAAKKRYASSVGSWIQAVKKARAALKIKGFSALKKGSPLYIKAKEFYQN